MADTHSIKIINKGEGLYSFWHKNKGYGYFKTRSLCENYCKEFTGEGEFIFIKFGDVNKGKLILINTMR